MDKDNIIPDIGKPPGFYYICGLCNSPMHYRGPWHCYTCGTDWELQDIWDEMDWCEEEDEVPTY